MRTTPTILGACALALLAAAPGFGKARATGEYHCVIGINNSLFGTLTMANPNSYTRLGKTGTFQTGTTKATFKDGRVGYTIRFKSGSLNGFSGRWYGAHGAGATHEIALKTPTGSYETVYCSNGN
jgi:hypothetical protein